MEPARVCIASCRDSAEAALVRSMLSAHGIAAVVSGERHAALLGWAGAAAISLDVWVDREDAEEAATLIRQLREGGVEDDAEPAPEEAPSDPVALDAHDADLATDAPDEPGPVVHWGLERRRRIGVTLLLSCVVTFGTGHLYTRAWMRGITLAAVELVGIRQLAAHPAIGGVMIGGAVLLDLVGSLIRVRRQLAAAQLPPARVHR